jgi:hypothetical protein
LSNQEELDSLMVVTKKILITDHPGPINPKGMWGNDVFGYPLVLLCRFGLISWLLVPVFFSSDLEAQDQGKVKPSQSEMNTIFIQAVYGSKTGTFGTFENEADQPSLAGTLTYITPFNLDINLQQYAINNSDDSLKHVTCETDLSMGYKQYFGKKFYAYGTFLHSFYSANSSEVRAQFTDQAGIETGYEGKYLNPVISGTMLFGEQREFILDLQQIFQFELFSSSSGNASLTILPSADLMMGKLQFYNEYLLQQYMDHPWRFVYYYHVRQNMTRAEIESMLKTEKKFTASNLNLSLPVTLSVGNWLLTATANAVKPFNQPEIIGNDWIFYFTASAGYMLSW